MKKYPCPCCGYLTHLESTPGTDDICDVCFWHDDVYQSCYPDSVIGANPVSLNQAKENFRKFGAKTENHIEYIRKPLPDEIP